MIENLPFIDQFPYAGLVFLFFLGTLGFPFPEDAILMLCGFLTAQKILKPLPAFLVVYLSLLMTDFSLYLAGMKYGRKVIEHKRFQRILSSHRLSKVEKQFQEWGVLIVFLGRHLLGLRSQLFLAAGILRMSSIKFLLTDAASALITISLTGGIGYMGGKNFDGLRKIILRVDSLGTLLGGTAIASTLVLMYFKKRSGPKSNDRR